MSGWLGGGQGPGINLKDQATAQPSSRCWSPNLGGKLGKQSCEQMCRDAARGGRPGQGPGQRQRQPGLGVTRRPEGLAWLKDSWEAEDIPQASRAGQPVSPWCHGLERH